DLVVVRRSRLNDLRHTQRDASRSVQLLHIVTAIAAYEVGNFGRVRSMPSEALVRVRVTGEHGVRPYAGLGADRVHLLPHLSAGGMLTANRIGSLVQREQQRPRVLLP